MDWIRAHGRLPREYIKANGEEGRSECKVGVQLRRMRASLPEEVKEELATLRDKEICALEQLAQEADPLSGFAEVPTNRLDQELQLHRGGVRTRELTRRLHKYEKYMADPVLQDRASVTHHKDRVREALPIGRTIPHTCYRL